MRLPLDVGHEFAGELVPVALRVVGFVRQTVRAKLEVANPKYLES